MTYNPDTNPNEPVNVSHNAILADEPGSFKYYSQLAGGMVDVIHITVTVVHANATSTSNVFKNINTGFDGVRFDDMVRFLRHHAKRSAQAWSDLQKAENITPDDPNDTTGIVSVYVNIHSSLEFHTYRFDGVEEFIHFVTDEINE
jgi:hypothetical protein